MGAINSMKTATYRLKGGDELTVEYDETAPCKVCGEPVVAASMGGTDLCPWCDMGECRYCHVQLPLTEQDIRQHMRWHREHP